MDFVIQSTKLESDSEKGLMLGADNKRPIDIEHIANASSADRKSIEDLAISSWAKQLEKSKSVVSDVTMGQLLVQTTCDECGCATYRCQQFHILELQLPQRSKAITLNSLLNSFSEATLILGFECPNCSQTTQGVRRRFFYRFPPVLIVSLDRFEKGSVSSSKNSCLVKIDLEGQDLGNHEKGRTKSESSIFDLYFVIVTLFSPASSRK